MLTQLPGFQDPVHDAQRTFRSLLAALARPSIPQQTASLTPPQGLEPACAAACLTLLDLETTVWLQPGIAASVRDWLLFHTGCQFTDQPAAATFALIADPTTAPPLDAYSWGTPEYPEASTSLLIQVPALTGGSPRHLLGPGILERVAIALPLPDAFWEQWQAMTQAYPLGLDVWCFHHRDLVGLPRTACLSPQEDQT